MIIRWEDIICSIKVKALRLVFEGFLIDPPECFTLVIHDLLWDFPNIQVTQGGRGGVPTLLILLVVIPLFDNMIRCDG